MTTSYSIAFMGIGSGFIDIDKSGDGDLFCFSPKKIQKKIVLKKYAPEGRF